MCEKVNNDASRGISLVWSSKANLTSGFNIGIDGLLKRNAEILQLPCAPERSVASLLNWVNATGSITRRETDFLHSRDLCAVGGGRLDSVMWMESLIESSFIHFYQSFMRNDLLKHFKCRSLKSATKSEKRIFLFEGQALGIVTHLCITALIVLLLLIPILVMQATSSSFTLQMVCITLMSILFIITMSGPAKARTAEIFGASATYRPPTTLLVKVC